MRQILIFSIAALALAAIVPQWMADVKTMPLAGAAAERPSNSAERAPSVNSRSVVLTRSGNGHFVTEAVVDGRRLSFMVDTGASVIALTRQDAARLGIHPAQREYATEVKTANGTVRAAPANLRMVEIGGVIVRDVRALVLPDGALSENLLGMSYLSRLRRFEYREGKLVLEQ